MKFINIQISLSLFYNWITFCTVACSVWHQCMCIISLFLYRTCPIEIYLCFFFNSNYCISLIYLISWILWVNIVWCVCSSSTTITKSVLSAALKAVTKSKKSDSHSAVEDCKNVPSSANGSFVQVVSKPSASWTVFIVWSRFIFLVCASSVSLFQELTPEKCFFSHWCAPDWMWQYVHTF